jgi:hypothetical protein
VPSGCAVFAITGIILIPGHSHAASFRWDCLFAKSALFIIAFGTFVYASWSLWPARVMATADEIPKFQRRFQWVALALIGIIALCFVLGIVAGHF